MLTLPELIRYAYQEDIPTTDITCDLTIQKGIECTATIISKANGIFFGTEVVTLCLATVDSRLSAAVLISDGDAISKGQPIVRLAGPLDKMVQLERVLLNFIQRLSGIATMTSQFVTTLNNPAIKILETRKTTPLLRDIEKQAVVAGGGTNHRKNLSDMVLIKENHLIALQNTGTLHTLRDRIAQFKSSHPSTRIEIEIETLQEIETLPLEMADIVMFDNFSMEMIESGAKKMKALGVSAEIEISGNVTLDTIASYRDLPIHRISVGALTHSVPSLDLSMRIHLYADR